MIDFQPPRSKIPPAATHSPSLLKLIPEPRIQDPNWLSKIPPGHHEASPPPPAFEPEDGLITHLDGAYVHTEPKPIGLVVCHLRLGTAITVIGPTQDGWTPICFALSGKDSTGYVQALRLTTPSAGPRVAAPLHGPARGDRHDLKREATMIMIRPGMSLTKVVDHYYRPTSRYMRPFYIAALCEINHMLGNESAFLPSNTGFHELKAGQKLWLPRHAVLDWRAKYLHLASPLFEAFIPSVPEPVSVAGDEDKWPWNDE